jgi:putative hemolysin
LIHGDLRKIVIRDGAKGMSVVVRDLLQQEEPHCVGIDILGVGADAFSGRRDALQVRLAVNEKEVAAAQRLRHRVFAEEMGARTARDGFDEDRFDGFCDHLIVLDNERIVGTYRLMTAGAAARAGGFYSQSEYDVAALAARHRGFNFLELGRSCVQPDYRGKRTIELLWQGIWAYGRKHGIDAMFGCASFPGTVPAAHALALSFLGHKAAAGGNWNAAPTSEHAVALDMMPAEAVSRKPAVAAMPPLVRAYYRLGAKFADQAVIDHDFGTTDVMVVLEVAAIGERYLRYYGAETNRLVPAA